MDHDSRWQPGRAGARQRDRGRAGWRPQLPYSSSLPAGVAPTPRPAPASCKPCGGDAQPASTAHQGAASRPGEVRRPAPPGCWPQPPPPPAAPRPPATARAAAALPGPAQCPAVRGASPAAPASREHLQSRSAPRDPPPPPGARGTHPTPQTADATPRHPRHGRGPTCSTRAWRSALICSSFARSCWNSCTAQPQPQPPAALGPVPHMLPRRGSCPPAAAPAGIRGPPALRQAWAWARAWARPPTGQPGSCCAVLRAEARPAPTTRPHKPTAPQPGPARHGTTRTFLISFLSRSDMVRSLAPVPTSASRSRCARWARARRALAS